MIPKLTIDKIIDAARVEEVIGDFITLKKRGANLLGLCPFHGEKSPSFTVSPAKGIYKCFGCGKSGTAVNFIMDLESLSYPEALKYLANKYGIEVVEKEISVEEKAQQSEKETDIILSKNIKFQQKYNKKENPSELHKVSGRGNSLTVLGVAPVALHPSERLPVFNPEVKLPLSLFLCVRGSDRSQLYVHWSLSELWPRHPLKGLQRVCRLSVSFLGAHWYHDGCSLLPPSRLRQISSRALRTLFFSLR